jgi:hypothetical protein
MTPQSANRERGCAGEFNRNQCEKRVARSSTNMEVCESEQVSSTDSNESPIKKRNSTFHLLPTPTGRAEVGFVAIHQCKEFE